MGTKLSWYNIKNESGEIFIYDTIGKYDAYSASKFIEDFNNIKSKEVTIHINSGGGAVFEGLAIYNTIKSSEKSVKIIIDGLCASIASIIACSGDEIEMNSNGLIMIHDPLTISGGNAKELRKQAEILDKIHDQLVNIYHERTGLDAEVLEDYMDKETWFTAQEALEAKLIDRIIETDKMVACVDLDSYNYRNVAKFELYKSKLTESKKGESPKMEKILKILNVTNEDEAVSKIKEMAGKITALESENSEARKVKNEQTIDLAIAQGKILPAKKEFAFNLLNTSEDLFNSYIENEKVDVPMGDLKVKSNKAVNVENIESFSQLLDDPELCERVKDENPELFNKLYDDFLIKGV